MSHSKRTPEMRQRLLDLRRMGLSMTKCFQAAGISKATVQKWREDDPTLDEELDKSHAAFIQEQHDIVVQGAKSGDTRDAKWLLEKVAPEDYGNVERHEHTFRLEMPGLLDAKTERARAWLSEAKDEDWKALDERARKGELLEADYELLEEPDRSDPAD